MASSLVILEAKRRSQLPSALDLQKPEFRNSRLIVGAGRTLALRTQMTRFLDQTKTGCEPCYRCVKNYSVYCPNSRSAIDMEGALNGRDIVTPGQNVQSTKLRSGVLCR